jgi:hypothetical protein
MTALKKEPNLQNAATIARSASSHVQQSWQREHLEEGFKRKLRTYLEKISLDLEEKKEVGIQLGC